MARVAVCFFVLVAAAFAASPNDVARAAESSEDLLWDVAEECLGADGGMSCLRRKVLDFMDGAAGVPEGRAMDAEDDEEGDDQSLDEKIFARVQRYVNTHQFRVELPDFFFQRATLTFRPARGLYNFQVEFPKEEAPRDSVYGEARDMMKKKMLLPLLMLLKLKMKALTPIALALTALKATKALIMSKIALVLVMGFLLVQVGKKLGMSMPMAMPMPEMPAPVYGAPAPAPTGYGAPAPAPAAPSDSYSPSWDPNGNGNGNGNGGPYSRVWNDAHQLAYSAYYAQQQQQPQQVAPQAPNHQ